MDEEKCCCGSGDAGCGVPKNKLKSIDHLNERNEDEKD